MTLVSRVFANRYEIQREIAQGGMAEVYLARDRLLERPVALKALFPEFAREPSFVERFRREAQAAANLNHPNIVGIHDWGQEGGTYFIVMEYVEGRTLRDVLRGDGPIDPHQAADIAAEIASALSFAHRNGVVHRDVKPGNVLLTPSGSVKVTDFGIARSGASDALTQTGSVMGTATYFSPEQAQGLPVDGRGDVYSLGVVLYEMVTGVAPFTGDSPVSVAYKHVRESPLPPSRRNPDLPPDLEQIILTALEKDPDLRYQSADDLRADLLRFRRGRPISAGPVTAIVAETAGDLASTVAAPRVPRAEATQVGTPAVAAPPPHRKRALATLLTLLILGLAIGLIIAVSQIAGKDAGKVRVPRVVGMQYDDAKRVLEDDGFTVRRETVANESEDIAENEVIEQDPAQGEMLDRGEEVTLTVKAGADLVTIPTVSNLSVDEATEALEDAGFEVRPSLEVSDFVPAGQVIRTDPPEGQQAPTGSAVTLVVSAGRERVRVPNVVGDDAADAAAILARENFAVQRQPEASEDVPEGSVIRTEPGPNEEVPRGSSVTLIVSSGPERVEVPSVIGQTEAEAVDAMRAAGLEPSVVPQPSTEANNGRVIAQNPGGGSQQPRGTAVNLVVGVYEAPPTTTTTPTTTAP